MTTERGLKHLLVAGALALAACGGEAEANGPDAAGTTDALVEGSARIINVETESLVERPFQEVIRLTGVVQADQDVTISAEETGAVRSIIREKGQAVSVGDGLIRIDDRLLRSQVAEAEAQAALAQQTWERRKRLYEESRVGSELAYLEARYAAEQSAARLQTLKERLDRTVVRAPIDGVLDMRYVEIGTMVNLGTEVARIVSLDPVKIMAGVPERYATDVMPGSEATVFFDVLDESFSGTVEYVGSTVNPRNRTFLVELVMANPGGLIKPEMVANVELVRRGWDRAIVIPQEALIRTEDGFQVFLVEGEHAVARDVVVGPGQTNEVMVESGLEPGEELIVVGQKQVADGDRVNIVGTR